jgi:porin
LNTTPSNPGVRRNAKRHASSRNRRVLVFAMMTSAVGIGRAAHADALPSSTTIAQAGQAVPTVPAPATPPAAAPNPLDDLAPRGLTLRMPAASDTIVGDAGGIRSALADYGIGVLALSMSNFANNMLPNSAGPGGGQQLYNGQKFTYAVSNLIGLTYDLRRYGIPDGQIFVAGQRLDTSWTPFGPDKLALAGLTYYQTLFNRAMEVKLGYLDGTWDYVGTFIGGQLSQSVFGPSANIPSQGGLNSSITPTPGAEIKFNITPRIYNKLLIQRSVNPDGSVTEATENPSGFRWSTPNSGTLYMDEFGYSQPAAANQPKTWLRAGAGYNTSQFASLKNPGTRAGSNSFYYLLGDRQLWQKNASSGNPAQGLYGGISVMYAPPGLNLFSRYYEARVYAIGPFDSRPQDMLSLVVTNTTWSRYAIDASLQRGSLTHSDSTAVTLSYSAHLFRGVYASLGIGYVNHPTPIAYTTHTGSALNALGSVILSW